MSIPDELLERVDREAKLRRLSRSALLQQAAQHELGLPDTATVDAAIDRARAALDGAGTFESVDAIRESRDDRDARDRRR